MVFLKDLNIAVVDTETTGLNVKTNEIIEIATIIYSQSEKQIVKEWSKKVAPCNIKTASKTALDMNGYNQNPESYTEDIEKVIREFVEIIDGCIILGQNINFDIKFIESYMNKFNISKTISRHRKLELSSIVWPATRHTKSMKLSSICDAFGVSNDGAHSALIDCKRTLEVYRKYMNTIEEE